MAADGVNSCEIITEQKALHYINLLDLKHSHRLRSSETNFLYIGEINNMIVEIRHYERTPGKYEYSLTTRGSLQKYKYGFNNGDFPLVEIKDVTGGIYELLSIDAVEVSHTGTIEIIEQVALPLNKSEVGINVIVGIDDLDSFLDINLLQHKKKPFTREDGLVFECKHENYYLKIYPKGANLLRIEIVLLTRELAKFKIFTLADITLDKVILILKRLKKEFAETIFADGINIHSCEDLSKKEEVKLLRLTSNWRNKQYLIDKRQATKRESKNLAQKMYRLGNACDLILENKGKGYKRYLVDLVNAKIDAIIKQAQESGADT